MATLVLSAVGAAFGAGFGGTVLGLSGAVIGRAIGATLGRALDQRLLGGSEAVEVGRIDRLRLTGASEGNAIPQVWGRMRIAGQVLWAAPFEEHASSRRGGKGGPKISEYSYTISLAIGLCAGRILDVGRIWADGEIVAPDSLTVRVYSGSEDQLPDPKIEAVEGAGLVPAFRGLAYVVLEDLDLSPWGNRVPQFTFEVVRAAQPGDEGADPSLADAVRAVALIPGTGEYALATTPVYSAGRPGQSRALNIHTAQGETDFRASLDQLRADLPDCASVSLVVSWFGNDLRVGHCSVRPQVEQQTVDGVQMPWRVSGVGRSAATVMPQVAGRPVYGGTPADASVVEAIRAIRAAGREVMFYPFILMDQIAGNTLPDPWSGETGQPVLPWRGRITTERAPGVAGTTDRTAAAEAEVAAFFGAALPGQFPVTGTQVGYSGPSEWSFRRFILHYAHLCAVAGGVEAFCIGSELRGITRIRNVVDGFPAVAALKTLAAEVKAILGPGCKVSYAADWTEYGSYQADGNLYFPLDPLWSDPSIAFVGIDNYMPVADWRDGLDHADAHWGTIYDLDYLKANVAGGEGFDWYYDSPEGIAAQKRLPIEDGAHDEPWVFRVKDLRSWWSLPHHPRTGAVREAVPTAWVPGSKPIRFTEYGCAAIDKGANQPNIFLDQLSSESGLPRASNGRRDDLMQMQYLRAVTGFWRDSANNPQSPLYAGRMVEIDRAHVWAWDARPFPEFPARTDLWSDAFSYGRGHWLNGRATNQPLDAVVREITRAAGVAVADTGDVHGVVRGYVQSQVQSARASLQPLMLAYGMDAGDRDGRLRFAMRRPGTDHVIDPGLLAVTRDLDGLTEFSRANAGETGGTVRLGYVDAEGVFDIRTAEARYPDQALQGVSATEVPLALTASEARVVTQRWLAESRIGRDGLRLALPPSRADVGAGDRLLLPDGATYRVDRVDLTDVITVEATRFEGGVHIAGDPLEEPAALRPFVPPVVPWPVFLDLPLLSGAEVPHQPHVCVAAAPWVGPMAVWAESGATFQLNRLLTRGAVVGVTETALPSARPGLWDRGPALRVQLTSGLLETVEPADVLNGANAMAIGDGSAGLWEVFQFAEASLVAPGTYDLSLRLRGQSGTDGVMPPVWPPGSTVVLLDSALQQLDLAMNARGLARRYRFGLQARGYDRPEVAERQDAFDGIGLRPYPVAHLRAVRSPEGDVAVRWIRRTRIDGDNWQQIEVPLGEDAEAYVVRVISGTVIVAEYQVNQPDFAYTAAQQAADGVSGAFMLKVAQVSSRFGTGPFRPAEVAV